MSDRLLNHTTGLCARCKRSLPAEVWVEDGQVVLRKTCPTHGAQSVLIAANAEWYEATVAEGAVASPPRGSLAPVTLGCPLDCGPCTQHQQRLHLPVVPITSACNLDCPICYTHNRNDGAWHLGDAELRAVLHHLRTRAPEGRIINLTGGEPTMHPRFVELLKLCREEGIHRVTISTHGMRFLHDDALLDGIRAVEGRVILSFDSFEQSANVAMLGGRFLEPKLKVLDRLEAWGIDTTLLPVLARGQNDHELGRFIAEALRRDFIRSVEFHPMTFTGQSGADFDRSARYDPYSVLCDLQEQTDGLLRVEDFVPAPVAHPLCYQVAYLLRLDADRWLPFTRFLTRAELRHLLRHGLYLEPGRETDDALQHAITRLWTGETVCPEADEVMAALKRLTTEMAAAGPEQLRVAERHTKAIYLHTHMDEETFDTDRIQLCCVGMPEADGRSVPSCAYNVIYRSRDERFVEVPEPSLVQIGPGRR
ncbi:MAG: radical SAM protein [Myxococcales bacterium]|nr:radical SAM protein [Myxococcales bacterium]